MIEALQRTPSNIYLRGSTYWARVMVNNTECRKSLRTSDLQVAAERAAAWKEQLRGHQWHGLPLPTAAVPRLPSTEWLDADPRRRVAHKAVQDACRLGKLKRLPCEVCGDLKSQAHHDDYDQPLDVRWLCPVHHRAEHTAQRKLTP